MLRLLSALGFGLIFCFNVFAGVIRLDDEGTKKGYIAILNCTGSGVSCTKSGITGTLNAPNANFGASIDDTELTAEDFGDFTCTGAEDSCSINSAFYAKDLVATSPLTVDGGTNVDNILVGADGDVTVAIKGNGVYSRSFIITNPTATADNSVGRIPYAITITAVHLLCKGDVVVGHLTEQDANGLNDAGVDGATDITGITDTNVNDDGSLSNPSIDANDYLGWRTTSVTGTPTYAIITYEYTIN